MFLRAYRARLHTVYLGPKGALAEVGRVEGGGNVVSSVQALRPNTDYAWRVDATDAEGTVRRGDLWEFTTGSDLSCS